MLQILYLYCTGLSLAILDLSTPKMCAAGCIQEI